MPSVDNDSNFDFQGFPPFPSDVPTVPLLRISLSKLQRSDAGEIDRLWKASRELGFFYLDFTPERSHHESESNTHLDIDRSTLLSDVDELFKVGGDLFGLPISEKVKYDFISKGISYFGYKGYGVGVTDAQGTKDRNEFYNVSKNDVFGISEPLPAPALLQDYRPLIRSYMSQCHSIVTLILEILTSRLGLSPGSLTSLHRLDAVSGDQLRWVSSVPQPMDDRKTALGQHTDFGSVTVLFNRLGGLQVQLPGTDDWQYVKPLRNHAIVNLGDALVKFSAGILHSNIHRVVNPPGAQSDQTRMSLVYFSRPEDDIILRALDESEMIAEAKKGQPDDEELYLAKDWIMKKAISGRFKPNTADAGEPEAKK